MLDRPETYDARALSRKAIQNWEWVWGHLVDHHGRPLGEIQKLSPNYVQLETGVRRHGAPRLVEFRGPDRWPNEGAWRCLGNGAHGDDWRGPCGLPRGNRSQDRSPVASSLVNRIVTVAA
jgi:hypothetical protein